MSRVRSALRQVGPRLLALAAVAGLWLIVFQTKLFDSTLLPSPGAVGHSLRLHFADGTIPILAAGLRCEQGHNCQRLVNEPPAAAGRRLDRALHAPLVMRVVAVVLSWNGREDTLAWIGDVDRVFALHRERGMRAKLTVAAG